MTSEQQETIEVSGRCFDVMASALKEEYPDGAPDAIAVLSALIKLLSVGLTCAPPEIREKLLRDSVEAIARNSGFRLDADSLQITPAVVQ